MATHRYNLRPRKAGGIPESVIRSDSSESDSTYDSESDSDVTIVYDGYSRLDRTKAHKYRDHTEPLLIKQKGLCNLCGNILGHFDIDHIVPKKYEDIFGVYTLNSIANLQAVCKGCHSIKTSKVDPIIRELLTSSDERCDDFPLFSARVESVMHPMFKKHFEIHQEKVILRMSKYTSDPIWVPLYKKIDDSLLLTADLRSAKRVDSISHEEPEKVPERVPKRLAKRVQFKKRVEIIPDDSVPQEDKSLQPSASVVIEKSSEMDDLCDQFANSLSISSADDPPTTAKGYQLPGLFIGAVVASSFLVLGKILS
jgi:HNH endonuclease